MLKDLFLVFALVLVACVDSWAECVQALTSNNATCFWVEGSSCSWWGTSCGATSCNQSASGSIWDANYPYIAGACFSSNGRGCDNKPSLDPCYESSGHCYTRSYVITTACQTQAEADSLACLNSGNVWLNGSCKNEQDICEDSGGTWENGSCNTCDEAKSMPNECERLWNTGYNLQGYWSAVVYQVTYNECTGEYTKVELSNVPEVQCSDIMSDSTSHPARCLAVLGSQCVMQSGNGQTYNCSCDGDCTQALISKDCEDPFRSSASQSSDSQSSASQSSASQSSDSQSSDSQSSPSSSAEAGSGSGGSPVDSSGGDWEYNYSGVLDSIKWQAVYTNSNLFNIGNTLNSIDRKLGNGSTTPGSSASGGVVDSLHRSNQILEGIANNTASLNDSLPDDYFDVSGFLASSDSILDKLQNPDTTYLSADSIAPDTSNFKTKYSKFFLSNNLTRNGCYEFRVRSVDGWKIGDVYINFGNLAGKFDFCAIVRGIIRICGAILCLIMTIKAYRTAFASGDD